VSPLIRPRNSGIMGKPEVDFPIADQPGVMVAMAVPSGFAADPIVDLRVAYITTAFAVRLTSFVGI
jgi:hypothetical protein